MLLFGAFTQPALFAQTAPVQFERSQLSIEAGGKRHLFKVEIAHTPATRARGLMERRHLDKDAGMLFDFVTPRRISMWMKNTYISLDMIFINRTGEIMGIASNTTPLSLRVISHPKPALAVLEVAAGTTQRLNISVGDKVFHRLFQP